MDNNCKGVPSHSSDEDIVWWVEIIILWTIYNQFYLFFFIAFLHWLKHELKSKGNNIMELKEGEKRKSILWFTKYQNYYHLNPLKKKAKQAFWNEHLNLWRI